MRVPRSQGFHERAQSIGGHPERAAHRLDGVGRALALRGDEQRFADGEHGDGERRHLDAVEQVRNAEAHAGLAGLQVDADDAKRQADEERRRGRAGSTRRRRPRR